MQIYLDTHPNDRAALEKAEKYKAMARPLIEQYEEQYGPLTKKVTDTNSWTWVKGPWPWESEDDC